MIQSGVIRMPLHFGKMPGWFTERMGLLGSAVMESVVQNYGKSELLTRMGDANWLQALAAVSGFQWNSSGVTAAVLGSVRPKINPMANELGLYFLDRRLGFTNGVVVRCQSRLHTLFNRFYHCIWVDCFLCLGNGLRQRRS